MFHKGGIKQSRFLSFVCLWVVASGLGLTQARATVVINQPGPYLQNDLLSTSFRFYFAAGTIAAPEYLDLGRAFRLLALDSGSAPDNFIWLDFSTNKAYSPQQQQRLVVTLSTGNTQGTEIPLQGATLVTGSADTTFPNGFNQSAPVQGLNGQNLSVQVQTNGIVRLGFTLASLCSVSGASGTPFCTAALGGAFTTPQTVTLNATFGLAADAFSTGPISATGDSETLAFSIVITNRGPSGLGANCTSLPDPNFYFPGDGEIYLLPENYGFGPGTSSVPIQNYLFLGQNGGTVTAVNGTTAFFNNSVVQYVEAGGTPVVSGFPNTTDGTDNGFNGIVYAVNRAGIVSGDCTSNGNTIYARRILGVLNESKCFIATATYHDGKAPPVLLLRQFRDSILKKSILGQQLIRFYYRWSPQAAVWAWDKPVVRWATGKILAPIEGLVFLVLNPIWLLLVCFLFSLVFLIRRRKLFPILFVLLGWAFASSVTSEVASAQTVSPYLDRIKKKLEQDQPAAAQESKSYTDRLKKKLESDKDAGAESNSGSYTERLRRKNGVETDTQSYTEKLRSELPAEEESSVIADVKAGKDSLKESERPEIKNAMGFRMGIVPGIGVTADGGFSSFADIYGAGWQPDFYIHYERQIYHSETWGSLGLTIEPGIAYSGGKGQFEFAFNGSTESKTNFSFIQFPLLLGANYRLNLLRILRPYAGVSAGPVGILETRTDGRGTKTAVTPVYAYSVGVSLLLDFFERRAMRESYDSIGVQHTYLFAEFFGMDSFNGKVRVSRSGIYSGFLFEF